MNKDGVIASLQQPRIGMVSTSYPRHRGDWAGGFVADLARYFVSQGDNIDVLAPQAVTEGRDLATGAYVRSIRYAKTPRLFFGAGAPDNLFAAGSLGDRLRVWAQVPVFLAHASRGCARVAPTWDYLLSHWIVPTSLICAYAGRSVPHLAVAHSSDVRLLCQRPFLARQVLRVIARPRSRLAVTSNNLWERLLRVTAPGPLRRWVEDALIMPMGVDSVPMEVNSTGQRDQRSDGPAKSLAPAADNRPFVLFVGRLVAVKGVHLLVEACANQPFRLVVLGDGPERSRLEALARERAPETIFIGAQDRDETQAWIAAATIVVLPSAILKDGRCDSVPLVLLETMMAGTAVIATDVGGISEIVESGVNGILVGPGCVAQLRQAIETLGVNRKLRTRLIAQARIEVQKYAWSRVGRYYRDALFAL